MLELAIFFSVISAVLRAFGPTYMDVANSTSSIAGIFALVWLVGGIIALVTYRPMHRRVLHHA